MGDLALAVRLARRELRAGLAGFRIFIACLALGVAAIDGADPSCAGPASKEQIADNLEASARLGKIQMPPSFGRRAGPPQTRGNPGARRESG